MPLNFCIYFIYRSKASCYQEKFTEGKNKDGSLHDKKKGRWKFFSRAIKKQKASLAREMNKSKRKKIKALAPTSKPAMHQTSPWQMSGVFALKWLQLLDYLGAFWDGETYIPISNTKASQISLWLLSLSLNPKTKQMQWKCWGMYELWPLNLMFHLT